MVLGELLTRDKFRERVFARDRYRCVVCDVAAKDAHHIVERRLWPDGGYYVENGASLCEEHHLAAEQTLLDCDEIRARCRITNVVLPPHLVDEDRYDKWGNPILDNGQRLRGELFDDESVQRILEPVLHLFTSRVKYPRTFHLPWSPGATDDDRVVDDVNTMFAGREVVVTEKLDGENTTMYHDYIHARSLEFATHPSRSRVQALHGSIKHDIPEGWRVCGENVFAMHSIYYTKLTAFFLVFSIWNERNVCLSWEETVMWTELLGLKTVPILYQGSWDESLVRGLYQSSIDGVECEGHVVRTTDGFCYRDFRTRVAKYVRAGHVKEYSGHWTTRAVVSNQLQGG